MVSVMPQEFDPQLTARFAQAERPLPDADFLAGVLAKIAARRRARRMRQWLLASVVFILLIRVAPAILAATAELIGKPGGLPLEPQLIVSPAGWAISMAIGIAVVLRCTPWLRRR
jgi:hypothetical protein